MQDVPATTSSSSTAAPTSTSASVCNSAASVESTDSDSSTSWSDTISSENIARLVLGLDLESFKDLRTAAMIVMMFNLMGLFSDIQMVRVGEVEFVEGGHLKVKTSYMVGNPDGLVFCRNCQEVLGDQGRFPSRLPFLQVPCQPGEGCHA